MRLIINSRGHPTENIAKYVEEELELHVKKQKSFIKDPTDFINKIYNLCLPDRNDILLFCMDVNALYPSVPRKEAIDTHALAERPDTNTDPDVSLRMMDFTLENNFFTFDGKNFLQTEGTAIGSKFGRNYACTY